MTNEDLKEQIIRKAIADFEEKIDIRGMSEPDSEIEDEIIDLETKLRDRLSRVEYSKRKDPPLKSYVGKTPPPAWAKKD